MIRHAYILFSFAVMLPLLLSSCKSAEEATDIQAAMQLDEARQLMEQKNYAAARDSILSLRRQHPTALTVRRAAILTLDSVELMETRDSIARYAQRLKAEQLAFEQMMPRMGGQTNEAYYSQQRLLFNMRQHFDELCAKAKFYVRKLDIDAAGEY
ncbi:MAG: hypothetical protein IJ209_03215 [Bacteroidaceae bacterium]|nr:hypothetical protein [Bacteroidaceae bacterium]